MNIHSNRNLKILPYAIFQNSLMKIKNKIILIFVMIAIVMFASGVILYTLVKSVEEKHNRIALTLNKIESLIPDFNQSIQNIITSEHLEVLEIQDEFNAYSHELFRVFVVIFVVSMLILLLLIRNIMNSIIKPITQLKNATQEIGKGHFDIDIDIQSKNEIGVLVQEVDNMKDALRAVRDNIIQEKDKAEKLRDKAQEASKAKSTFLANMSHEIRTPMNSILGFSDMLSKTALNDKQKLYLDSVQTNGRFLLDIINDILDYSKLESNKINLESIDFDLEYLVQDVFKMLAPKYQDKNIEAFIDIEQSVVRNVKGDPTRLRQILINLLSNSIKFTNDGEVGVQITFDSDSTQDEKLKIHFCVTDTGLGIPNDKLDAIFSSFSQADNSTTRKFGGSGLGLSICKSLVEMMGGKIWAESSEGKGSMFHFKIYLNKGTNYSDRKIVPLSREELRDKKVIVVDDNDRAREILCRYCEELEMKIVTQAESVHAAFNQLDKLIQENKIPNLILSEIVMGQTDGYELARKIKNNQDCQAIKIIAVTSDLRVGSALDARKEGFDGYLSKPVSRNDLENVMKVVLGDRRGEGQIVTRHLAEEISCTGIHLLAVEDSLPNQMLLKAYFEQMGCTADYANNGKEAIEKMKTHQYDLILMDLQMPVMSGDEATKIIRAEISKDVPILALTAAALKEDEVKCREAGMNDFITKPINFGQLKKKIFEFGKKNK